MKTLHKCAQNCGSKLGKRTGQGGQHFLSLWGFVFFANVQFSQIWTRARVASLREE